MTGGKYFGLGDTVAFGGSPLVLSSREREVLCLLAAWFGRENGHF